MQSRVAVVVTLVVAVALAGCTSGSSSSGPRPPRVTTTTSAGPRASGPAVIIDTDLSRWWDDATALGLANVLMQQGKVNVLGIGSDIRNPVAVAAIDAIDTAYGHAAIPLGAVAHSAADTAPHGYSDAVAARLPHTIRDSADVPDAVALYRRLLAAQPDHSVTVVALGAYTNLAGLLTSARALVVQKVERLVIEDGFFPGGGAPATNQKLDLAAARVVVGGRGWPTPIAWVDGLDGIGTRVGSSLCTAAPANNPMRVVYQQLFGCGAPRDGDWDAPTLLYAIGAVPRVFTQLGRGGAAVLNAKGGLSWQAQSTRPDDVYVHLAEQNALNAFIDPLLAVGAKAA
ncbi:MAG TPA: nucleoside hydrolase [Acidimicrobiia bacterium]|nr:nucleoside hydrolase [Acidimicrobiia bacterium]